MKKGEIYEGVIEKIDFQNKGRVKIKDTTVTVKNGIPGQKVRFMINKKRGGRVEGRLLEVLEKSELEKRDPLWIMNILLSRSKEARSSLHIATKWNFLLGMNTKTGHCHLDFIKKAAHMMC